MHHFYAAAYFRGRRHYVFRLSVFPFICLSVLLSVCPSVQNLVNTITPECMKVISSMWVEVLPMIQWGPIIPQFVKLRFRLSLGSTMDPQLLDSDVLGASNRDLPLRTIVARPEKSNELVPNRDLTLKMRVLKHPLGEYFGT